MANDEQIKNLIALDQKGFFASAGENYEEFLTRVQAMRQFKNEVVETFKKEDRYTIEDVFYLKEEVIPDEILFACQNQSKSKYFFEVEHVPAFFSSRGLNFLFGGMALSFEDIEGKFWKNGVFSLFQLRRSFKKREKYIIYSRNEIISHESCHVARAPFKAIEYEEYFAYQSSTSGFRKWFGPALWRGMDMIILMLTLLAVFAVQIRGIVYGNDLQLFALSWVPFALYLSFIGVRSYISRKKLGVLRELLFPLVSDEKYIDAVLFRMTDDEIKEAFHQKSFNFLLEQEGLIKWQVIKSRFLK